MIVATVPDDNAAGAVIALRDNAFKILVIKRMVFNQDCQPFQGGIKRRSLRDSPAFKNSVQFQPEIIMESPCRMFMNDKNEMVTPRRNLRLRFLCFPELAFGLILG